MSKAMKTSLLLSFLIIFSHFDIDVVVDSQKGVKENDRIKRLPGQPFVKFFQFGGYVTLDKLSGSAFYYYCVEAHQSKETLPLLLWLNGGPGCSSLAYGTMQESGPFRVNSDGKTLHQNRYSWNYAANVLFLESPIGDDLTLELRELGWSELDLHKEDKKSENLSLEGELSSLIGKTFAKTGEEKGSMIDKSEVVALKRRALALKRKALICGMDDDKEFSNLHDCEHDFDFDNLLGITDNLDGNLEVIDEDLMDPELAGALESLGWTEPENTFSKSQTFDKEALLSEIQLLKREAVNQKRASNTEEAMTMVHDLITRSSINLIATRKVATETSKLQEFSLQ
ncbi:hypothetical protein KIW84_020935 [Lathyrus oleraceus]|uniref:Uncharacterized protein n=1 Tax=Pisum sativum TaxID=3888 RepID=A0A9D4YC52_PEA|nr:hypothetical protein KIW84_020935 [Pisum sativum]